MKKYWYRVIVIMLCCIALQNVALAEFGVSSYNDRGYCLNAYTTFFDDGYEFRLDIGVQYDPSFSEEERISAFLLMINGVPAARVEKWREINNWGKMEHRADFDIRRYRSECLVEKIELIPIWDETETVYSEAILLHDQLGKIPKDKVVYVQNDEASFVPVYSSPEQKEEIGKLLNGVKLEAFELESQEGWMAVYLDTITGGFYGYMESRFVYSANTNECILDSALQLNHIEKNTELTYVHDQALVQHIFAGESMGVVLGKIGTALLISTDYGIGCIDSEKCKMDTEMRKVVYSFAGRRGSELCVEACFADNGYAEIGVHITYPENYTVNDDIERFAVYVNDKAQNEIICIEPYERYRGIAWLEEGTNDIMLVPIWYKGGEIGKDAVRITLVN